MSPHSSQHIGEFHQSANQRTIVIEPSIVLSDFALH